MPAMSSLLLERGRYVLSLIPTALVPAAAGVVGWFVKLGECAKLVFIVLVEGLADGETAVCTVVEATNAAGAGRPISPRQPPRPPRERMPPACN
jgi:hypothetical protein